jgi:cytochrome c551
LAVLLAALVAGTASCAKFAPATGGTPAEQVYNQNCITCHGKTGGGADGPNLLERDLTRTRVVNQITNGGNGMPRFSTKLTPEQIEQAADWVTQLRKQIGKDTPQ